LAGFTSSIESLLGERAFFFSSTFFALTFSLMAALTSLMVFLML